MTEKTRVPASLRSGIVALLILLGAGGALVVDEQASRMAARNAYIQAVAADAGTSRAVKIAMVMGAYYESSYKHIGTPYIDYNGKGRPLTVCNGITGKGVVAGKYYTPPECYALERARYLESERFTQSTLVYWASYDDLTRATFIDFVHNKGGESLELSTMLRLANTGQLQAACAQNTRWNKGTVNGIKQVLPGLEARANANAELCWSWSPA